MRQTFTLQSDWIALCDLLKYCAITESGGEAKHFIAEGNVHVDGTLELRKRRKIHAGQTVTGEGFEIHVTGP
ncbi:RNA-binding S4 domain-containing protein [Acrocarpospora catenulata]|uniref:RNA-binding S4 domain-containing protein n=1 Tax=Acrocarpospora catenulata TaxID=2836182 RepID=UPI001BDAC8DC|nr:RNA-binding S4 domain-containing protein [Acrocarpospora catenulata]